MKEKTRVLLADDHKIVLEGLKSLLESEFWLVGSVENGRDLLTEVHRLRPDVIVVDISMPLLNGIEAVREIRKTDPDIKIIFLTMHPDVTYATRAFEAGASGYILKHSASTELVKAIHEAVKGRTYITPMIAGQLIQTYKAGKHAEESLEAKLTPRQTQVLQLLAEGYSAKRTAAIMNISPRTVEFHKYRIMEELNIKSNAELIQVAIKHGIVTS
ncbi:MAG: response regulator transcription factor [Deltaproteobacteria bacterium]|nr:response regulator transcription factor [Deltaproteobacteria bacterium]